MLNLLLGTRPGELGRTKIQNWDRAKGWLTLEKTKPGFDVVLPISPQIDEWLGRALAEAHRRDPNGEYLFPSRGSFTRRFDGDVTPYGHALRRTYKTLAAELLVPDKISASLLGHSVGGMSQIYIVESVLIGGVSVPAGQRKISERMYELFAAQPALAAPLGAPPLMIAPPLATESLVDAG
jgi:integrase